MSEDQKKNEAVFRKLIEEGYNKGHLDVVTEVFAAEFVEHQAGIIPPNADGVRGSIAFLRAAFPDLTLNIEDSAALGDKTWARIVGRGTHSGPFMGMPPSGKSFEITVIDVCRYKDARIIEHWGVADQFSLMRQLGALPATAPDRK
jgi:predicted ester cyclase